MKILVTGGSGYIGSFTSKSLLDKDYEVVIADDLERGHKEVLDKRATLEQGNLLDKDFVAYLFQKHKFDGVIHFAGYISMAESTERPYMYFENNVFTAINLLDNMYRNGVNNFIFSSTAGVYGSPKYTPIPEDHPKNPENPYGESKLIVERILSWSNKIHGISFAALRYFNASGAALDGSMGEGHNPETHIIPNAIKAALKGTDFILYGEDYDTPDKTCVRDYIHILDLAEAHILALNKLIKDKGEYIYNVGTGKGYSNKEVIEMVKMVSGIDFKVNIAGRRPGDVSKLVADPTRIQKELSFRPYHSSLGTIVETAWLWHKKSLNN